MVTFYLVNLGCRASQADGAALKRELLQAGLEEVPDLAQSQVAVLNTCTVTAAADAEVRQLVRRIHRLNPGCRVLVTGCYAQRAPEEIARLEGVAWVVGNSHKHRVSELLKPRRGLSSADAAPHLSPGGPDGLVVIQPCAPPAKPESAPSAGARVLVGEIGEEFHFAPVYPDDRTRPTLKVQDGCNARCAFCVIPYVRGRSRSLAPQKVIEQIQALEARGYREVVLSGINLGSYGRDLDPRCNFLGLLEHILAETNMPRIRISSIEPMDVSPSLIRLVAREPRLAQHFHVPLQSGSDRILRLMNRRYWANQYAERVWAIREQIPFCGIGADVMAGFPGEREQDHAASARFIQALPFTYLHVFPYSARPGTPAAVSSSPVDGRRVHERAREIRGLIAEKRSAFLAAHLGRSVSALTLEDSWQGARLALTTNYLKVALPNSPTPPNCLCEVWVGRVHEGLLHGTGVEVEN